MQYSFYGGQQGKDFKISKIFHNKVELMQDLMTRWQSSIGIGELVVISYGLPSDLNSQSYQTNRDLDSQIWGFTYNASVWQKIYTEDSDSAIDESLILLRNLNEKYKKGEITKEQYQEEYYKIGGLETQYIIHGLDEVEQNYERGTEEYYEKFKEKIEERDYVHEDYGLGYKLVASLLGSTPVLSFDFDYLNANELPKAWLSFDNNNLENPILYFRSPQAQEFKPENVSTTKLNVGEDPEVIMDTEGQNEDGTLKVNKPTLEFKLPQSQNIVPEHVSTTTLDADEEPEVVMDKDGENADGTLKVNEPSLEFKLPQAQRILPEHVSNTELDADETPEVIVETDGEYDNEYEKDGTTKIKKINQPSVEFKLPQAQRILQEHITTKKLNANEDPFVLFDSDKDKTNDDNTKKINQPSIQFQLPQSQIIGLGTVTIADADQPPAISLDESDINHPKLNITLPQNQIFGLSTITVLDADKDPTISIDKSDINNPKLNIGLPRSQILRLGLTNILAPNAEPKIEYDDETNVNEPELTFSLPRAARFMYGDRLGKRKAVTYELELSEAEEIEDLLPGDYYINKTTGFIYLLKTIDEETYVFEYQACLAAPSPTINSATINPYRTVGEGFELQKPSIETSWSNSDEKIGLVLSFKMPKLPNLNTKFTFVGSEEEGKVEGAPSKVDEFTYSFTIPTGARFFCGGAVDSDHTSNSIEEARPGDFYINGIFGDDDDGKVYKLNAEGEWEYQGSIKGNAGNPLNIIADYTITSEDGIEDSLEAVSAYLEEKLDGVPANNEIIAVTYRSPGVDDGVIDTAYWYYAINGTWYRAQLTGATASLIENTYKAAGDANKAYSVTYINNLLAALDAVLTPEEKKIKTYSASAIEELVTWGNFEDL